MSEHFVLFREKLTDVEPRLVHFSIGTALFAIALWLVLDAFGPAILDHGYQARSSVLFHALWSGGEKAPISEYLSVFGEYIRAVLFILLYLAGALYLLARPAKGNGGESHPVRLNLIILGVVGALIVLRDPALFYAPRFWAEEATVYFKAAYSSPFSVALITPHQNYYSLWTNLAGILATIPPLRYAPAVTTGMALIVQLAIFLAILANDALPINTTLTKAIACSIALVVGATGEIWLTSTNSQHYLALLVFLILIDSKQNPIKRRAWYFTAAISGLSGVAANFLTPLFLLRYWQRRDRADLALFMILAVTSVVQLVAISYSFSVIGGAVSQHRFHSTLGAKAVIEFIVQYILVYPFFGGSRAFFIVKILVLPIVVLLAIKQWREWWAFLLAPLVVITLSVISSLGMYGGPRYAYSSAVILAIMLLYFAGNIQIPKAARLLAGILLAVSMTYWTVHFMFGLDGFRNSNWPVWSSEVAAWQKDPCRKLQVHPAWHGSHGWFVELPPKSLAPDAAKQCSQGNSE